MSPVNETQNWARAERLDADLLASALAEQAGIRLIVEGPCEGGQVGAAYVRWPDGRRSVLKWRPQTDVAEMQAGPEAVVDAVRSVGYPAPATELIAQVGHAVVTVQELLPGTKIDRLTHSGLDQALALNELQADRLTDSPEVPQFKLYLRDDGPGFCLHEPLRKHSRRSARLEDWLAAVGAEYPDQLPGDDAVHADFHPGNMLAVDESITGVIDWDGAARGDRRLDLVTLRFGLHPAPGPGLPDRLDSVLDTFPEEILRPAWAHMSLRMVDWAIRHFSAPEVDAWLDLAERRID